MHACRCRGDFLAPEADEEEPQRTMRVLQAVRLRPFTLRKRAAAAAEGAEGAEETKVGDEYGRLATAWLGDVSGGSAHGVYYHFV